LDNGTLVVVQRQWNDWRTAMVRLTDLENIHWFQPDHAPRPLIHADVCRTKVLSGTMSEDCQQSSPQSRLRVCVLKCHTAPGVFEELSRRADQAASPGTPASLNHSSGHQPAPPSRA
jgi:hypothetical protein